MDYKNGEFKPRRVLSPEQKKDNNNRFVPHYVKQFIKTSTMATNRIRTRNKGMFRFAGKLTPKSDVSYRRSIQYLPILKEFKTEIFKNIKLNNYNTSDIDNILDVFNKGITTHNGTWESQSKNLLKYDMAVLQHELTEYIKLPNEISIFEQNYPERRELVEKALGFVNPILNSSGIKDALASMKGNNPIEKRVKQYKPTIDETYTTLMSEYSDGKYTLDQVKFIWDELNDIMKVKTRENNWDVDSVYRIYSFIDSVKNEFIQRAQQSPNKPTYVPQEPHHQQYKEHPQVQQQPYDYKNKNNALIMRQEYVNTMIHDYANTFLDVADLGPEIDRERKRNKLPAMFKIGRASCRERV